LTHSDPFHEWGACAHLRQSDIDKLLASGVPPLALAQGSRGIGFALARDRIVPHREARRFEFTRHDETAGEEVCSLIVLALDARGVPVDLVAFHAGATPFIGSWLGRVGLLGEEQIRRARDVLQVHATPLSWLRAGRDGVCVVDPVRAAPMLRDAGTMVVATPHERRRLVETISVRLPPIIVRPTLGRAAA
jgi:hypothetical protein